MAPFFTLSIFWSLEYFASPQVADLTYSVQYRFAIKYGVKKFGLNGDSLPVKRIFDFVAGVLMLTAFFLPLLVVALMVKFTSNGPVLYWSDRVGRNNQLFRMPKFRTMRIDTPELATHLLENPDQWLTVIGPFLRKTSLDELPQLWSILKGDMSFVGPRPALYNQSDLIALRTEAGVNTLVPGLTGWAQINGRDELPIYVKVKFDKEYLERHSLWFDLKIIWLTFKKVLLKDGVSH